LISELESPVDMVNQPGRRFHRGRVAPLRQMLWPSAAARSCRGRRQPTNLPQRNSQQRAIICF